MKLDGAIFSIEPRTLGGCIDLAVVFLREHFIGMVMLIGLFAVPSAVFHYWLVDACDWSSSGCVFLFTFECPMLAAVLVNTAGTRAFGDRFSIARGLTVTLRRLPVYCLLVAISRCVMYLAAVFFIFPGYIVATRYGFLAEVLYLERTPIKKYETRLSDLLSKTFGTVLGRLLGLMTFYSCTVLALFMLVDLGCSTLFGFKILTGRFSGLENIGDELEWFLVYDPTVTAVLTLVMWVVYAVTRLAWMFCYLDIRIRKEGWDLEIDARVEGRRLEVAA